ncbi:MAG: phenylacetate--CoA ligase [Thermoplasmata archaeon HGW-Thermoplasmata-2]|nr:MAG: phenylacetate--CoA ligase [Thermoplasmata archaeon HGW-Thermoplasmata-2]
MAPQFWNRKIETMPRAELDALKLKNLKSVVKRAYNIKFYRDEMKKSGLRPEEIKTLGDIRKLPFTTKDDLRKGTPFGMLATKLDDCIELHASSGTTGTPITVAYTRKDIEIWSEVMARCLSMAGLTKKDIFQNPIPYGTFTGAFGFHYGALKVGALTIPSGMGQSERQINLMKYYGTTFISGVVSYAAHLGQVAQSMGLNPAKDLKVRKGLFGSEMFTPGLKKKIADLWDMDVYDIYGLTEMCGPGVSTDCHIHDGLHLWEDHFFAECLDKNGDPVDAEEEGELVLTTLTKEGMPVLRFKTHDLTFLYDERKCECGRTHVKHAPIKGRTDDMLIISGTNVFPGQIESVLMKNEKVGLNYRILLSRKGDMDKLAVEVESKEKMSAEEKAALERKLQNDLKISLLLTPEVKILEPGAIPKDTIKAKRVIDLRGEKS